MSRDSSLLNLLLKMGKKSHHDKRKYFIDYPKSRLTKLILRETKGQGMSFHHFLAKTTMAEYQLVKCKCNDVISEISEQDTSRKRASGKNKNQSSPVSESSKKATPSSSNSRSRQKRQRITSDSSSGEDIPKTSKISKQMSESCSSNAETDPEGENVSQLSDVLIQHGKKKAAGVAGKNKPTISDSNEVQKIKMPFDKLVVNVKRLDETGMAFYDVRNKTEYYRL